MTAKVKGVQAQQYNKQNVEKLVKSVIELVAYYTHLHDFGLLVSKGISQQELDSMLVLRAGRIALGEMAIALLVSILAGLFIQYIVFLLSAILAKHLCVVLFEHFFTTRISPYRLLKW